MSKNELNIAAVPGLPNSNDTVATSQLPVTDENANKPQKKQKVEIPPMPKIPLSANVKHVRKIDIAVKTIMSVLGVAAQEIYGIENTNGDEGTEEKTIEAGVYGGVACGTALLAGLAIAGTKFWWGLRKFGHCLCPAEKGGCMVCQHEEVVDVKHGFFGDTAYVRDAGGCHCSCEDVDPDYAKTSRFKWPEFTKGEKAATIVSQLLFAGVATVGNVFIPIQWAAMPVAAVCFAGLSAAPYVVEKIHDKREWKRRFLSGNKTAFYPNLTGEAKYPVPSEFKGIVEYAEHISRVIGMIKAGKLSPDEVWKQNVLLPEGGRLTIYDLSKSLQYVIDAIKEGVKQYDEAASNFETVDTKQWLSEYRSDIDPREIAKLPFGEEMEYVSFERLPVPEKWDDTRGSYVDFVLQTAKLLSEGKITEKDAASRGVIPIEGASIAGTCGAWLTLTAAVQSGEITAEDLKKRMYTVSDADAYWASIKEREVISANSLGSDVGASPKKTRPVMASPSTANTLGKETPAL